MVKIENYPNAYKEVYVILNSLENDDLKRIPESFMKMIKNNMNPNYYFELDKPKDFESQELLQETKVILAYIFINYWSTEEQKAKIKQKFKQDIMIEERKKGKYNPDELFKKEKNEYVPQNKDVQIVEYKENILTKLINIIKSLFKK